MTTAAKRRSTDHVRHCCCTCTQHVPTSAMTAKHVTCGIHMMASIGGPNDGWCMHVDSNSNAMNESNASAFKWSCGNMPWYAATCDALSSYGCNCQCSNAVLRVQSVLQSMGAMMQQSSMCIQDATAQLQRLQLDEQAIVVTGQHRHLPLRSIAKYVLIRDTRQSLSAHHLDGRRPVARQLGKAAV